MGVEQVWRTGSVRLALSALAVALVLLAVSCASGENAQGGGQEGGGGQGGGSAEGEENASGGGNDSGGEAGEGGSGGEATGAEERPAEPEKPYAAIKPSADAIPLSERIGEDEEEDEEEGEGGGSTTGDAGASTTASDQYQYDQYGNQYGQYDDQYAGGAQYEEPEVERTVPVGEVLLKGREDESDGPLKENRLVAFYGHPSTGLMGELGQYPTPQKMMDKLKEQTAEYSEIDPERPAVPMIELIASVAQRDPMSDGSYLTRLDRASIEEYAKVAERNNALLMLDVQLGRSTVMEEFEALRPFLERPYVHLAIDTEYSVEEGEVPGVDLGEVDGPEIQEAVEELDRMVEEEGIPDKVLMIHQFESGIVTNKDSIKPTENVEVVLHADGFGGPAAKKAKYDLLVRDEDPIQYGGFKLFYPLEDPTAPGQDVPLLEPLEVLSLDPAPAIVTYQ